MNKIVIVLTAGFGNGHNTAASGIVKNAGACTSEIIDIAEENFFGKMFQYIFEYSPFWFLKMLYNASNRKKHSRLDRFFINFCFKKLNRKLEKIVKNKKAGEILEIYITFPMLQLLYVFFSDEIKKHRVIIQCTDFHAPHFSWGWNAENISEIRLLDAHAKKYFLEYKIKNSEKIKISPFPLTLDISENTVKNSKTILLFFHNVLLGNEEEILKKICTSQKHPEFASYTILILGGKNYKKIVEFPIVKNGMYSIKVLEWIQKSEIHKYYAPAEIVGGKCGGAFISEVIALQKKLIITGTFSVQEEGNLQFLQENYKENIVDL